MVFDSPFSPPFSLRFASFCFRFDLPDFLVNAHPLLCDLRSEPPICDDYSDLLGLKNKATPSDGLDGPDSQTNWGEAASKLLQRLARILPPLQPRKYVRVRVRVRVRDPASASAAQVRALDGLGRHGKTWKETMYSVDWT